MVTGTVSVPTGVRGRHLVLLVTLAGVGVGVGLDVTLGGAENPFLPVIVLTTVLDALLADAVLRRRPGHTVGRVFRVAAVAGALVVVTGGYADAALNGALPLTGVAWTLWLNRWLWVVVAAAPVALLFVFPDGRLPSPRWRPAVWFAAVGVGLLAVQSMAEPFSVSYWRDVPVLNPLGPGATDLAAALRSWPPAAFVLATAAGVAALVTRRVHATGDDRERLRWVVPPAVLVPPALFVSMLGPWWWGGVLEMVTATAFAVAVAVATVRHRMYDADVALDRAVVSGLLVASLLGAYVAVVVLVSRLVTGVDWLPEAVGAAVVAVAFGPLHQQLRRGADGLLFGSRRAPDEVSGRLLDADPGGHTDPEDVLRRAAQALRTSLRLPWVRIESLGMTVTSGDERTTGQALTLARGDLPVGTLTVGRRYDGERVRSDDPALAAAAAQLALTVDALRMAAELQQARDQMGTARDRERRRIHHDLHDGLGSTLAGVCLGLEAAEELAVSDPAAAARALPELRVHARRAVDDVRRLVEGLRPDDLDELGLVGALRTRLDPMSRGSGPRLEVDLPDVVPPLPRATELAALRICLEAVTNAVRHSGASRCQVRVAVDDGCCSVEVVDDGRGLGCAAPHVGLVSMRERAAQARGSLEVGDAPGGGTRVSARLPVGGAR